MNEPAWSERPAAFLGLSEPIALTKFPDARALSTRVLGG